MNTKKLVGKLDTYRDITRNWIEASLRDDDSLRVCYRSRWQGSTDGRTVLYTHTGLIGQLARDEEQDADAAILAYIERVCEIDGNGKLLRRGHIVR